jgi:lysophospholipase L1-like esterase
MWKTLADDFPGKPVIRRGFGGSQLADSVRYADRIVTPYAPRGVVLYAGDNDIASGKTPEKVLADYRDFVARVHAKAPEARIAYISIKPSPKRAALMAKMRAANEAIRAEAARDPRLVFIDVFTPMLGADGQPRPELFLSDRLHMNATGYALWTERVRPFVESVTSKPPPAAPAP